MREHTDAARAPMAAGDHPREPRARRAEAVVTYAAVIAVIAAALLAAIMHDARDGQDDSAPAHSRATTAGRELLAPQPPRPHG